MTNHTSSAEHHTRDPMAEIEAYCKANNVRFTKLRRLIYQMILDAKKPVGAYDLLDELNRSGRRSAPPTVYRSLDFLLKHGFIHRLAGINSFLPCCHPQSSHLAGFFICKQCNSVLEFQQASFYPELKTLAKNNHFAISDSILEVYGVCQSCQ